MAWEDDERISFKRLLIVWKCLRTWDDTCIGQHNENIEDNLLNQFLFFHRYIKEEPDDGPASFFHSHQM